MEMPVTHIRRWKQLSTRIVYQNPWMTVQEDRVQLPNGQTTIYGIVTPANNFVGIVPLLDSDTVVLVRQYRYTQQEVTWEIPSGALGPQEPPTQAAQRELREEAGYEAGHLTLLGIMRSNKAFMRDLGHIFLAEDLTASKATCDATEEIELAPLPLHEALAMIGRHEITDCVSIIGLLLASERQARP
jgi:8-oxo-dGTP pyrophosphatase MutT (NUDIX family)